ncbi:YafY family protein [Pseudonocardia sp. ICBG1142]|uniref:helix-turn-helix transcriptional regulator n=1 Tax=Pseudonocardia sp. ICBG1142 TaxID=2846760 RepID=UPI001CF70759|nr:WYL domain-containing protein [Pseudonocardia sp. ICBG1142]
MRADRLVSLVLLLRRRGRMSASALAAELEVSTRTVLRDIDALSSAGVPVHAQRGPQGGFELLPGFRTELTGLTHDEAVALLAAGSQHGVQAFGLGSALASAVLKVVDALPPGHPAADVAERLLVEPDTDLLARRRPEEDVPGAVVGPVRRAVLEGRRLRIQYAARGTPERWRTVDPVGLVTVRGTGYLLAIRTGEQRTYRLSRITAADVLLEPANRPDRVDLDRAWRDHAARFRAGPDQVRVTVRVDPSHREMLTGTAVAVHAETVDDDGFLRLDLAFQDRRHAEWALWRLGAAGEALGPPWLRAALHDRARAVAECYADPPSSPPLAPGERRT